MKTLYGYLILFISFSGLIYLKHSSGDFVPVSQRHFNINTNIASNLSGTTIANQHSFNKLLIPNENSNSGTGITTIHKAKKLNYICSINPCRLSQLTGSITNMNNGSIFNEETDLRMIVELVIIARD